MKVLFAIQSALVLFIGTAACGINGDSDDAGSTTLTVYAAASLTSTFGQLGENFEEAHQGVNVEFNFAGSSDLIAQIQQGAPADVFASADEANMRKLTAEGLAGSDAELFATNVLEIAVPPNNPAAIQSLQDLANPGINLVICAPEVPCGAAAQSVADIADVELQPDSEEQSVTDVLAKVVSGEADAGLIYVTDVVAAGGDVKGIQFPESESVRNNYPIATVAESEKALLAQEFVKLVLSDEGQRVLADAGFGQP